MTSTASVAVGLDELLAEGSNSDFFHHLGVVTVAHELELVWVELVKQSDWDAHNAVVIDGDVFVVADVNRVVIHIGEVLAGLVGLVEDEILVTLLDVKVGEPAGIPKTGHF